VTLLGAWLKQIVMIVLLAVFADLLLPTKAMQKYVRTVLGLAIIAAMLQPIVPFLRPDFADKVAQLALSEFDKGQAEQANSSGAATNYQHVLQQQQNSQANQLLGEQILRNMPRAFRQAVTSVSVTGSEEQPNTIGVTVNEVGSSLSIQDLKQWVATYLNILPQQVTIVTGGGVGNGLENNG